MSLVGVGRSLRHWRSGAVWVARGGKLGVFPPDSVHSPHTPGHDGVRQFLPAFGMLAVMAGLGAATAVERFSRWGIRLSIACLAEGIISVALMMPVPLSYFSPLAADLPCASALGMEPTYYWDALSDDALDWLKANTKPGQKVAFSTFPTSWLYLREPVDFPPACSRRIPVRLPGMSFKTGRGSLDRWSEGLRGRESRLTWSRSGVCRSSGSFRSIRSDALPPGTAGCDNKPPRSQ